MAQGNQDELDRVLDVALAKLKSEPRAGLEERVLANLRAETARGAERVWRRWGVLAAVAAALVIVAALSWRPGRSARPTNHVAIAMPTTQPASTQVAASGEPREVRLQAGHALRKTRRPRAVEAVTAAAQPKLEQFPSPQPLSEQERALARYVSQFPHEAELIARAQEEYEKEIQQLMKNASGHTEGGDSDEKER